MAEIHEDDHSVDSTGEFQEPEGGWITAPLLVDTELLITTLCRFTGVPVGHDAVCAARLDRRHPDVDCRAFYVQVDALRAGQVDLSGFGGELPEEIRLPLIGNEPTGGQHA